MTLESIIGIVLIIVIGLIGYYYLALGVFGLVYSDDNGDAIIGSIIDIVFGIALFLFCFLIAMQAGIIDVDFRYIPDWMHKLGFSWC